MSGKEIYNVREFAGITDYSDRSIRKMLKDGRIRGTQVSDRGEWRIPATEVKRFGEGTTRPSVTPQPQQPPPTVSTDLDPPTEYAQEMVRNPANWINAHERLFGTLPPVPDWLEGLIADGPKAGEPICKDMNLKVAGPETWCKLTPSQKEMLKGLVEWLAVNAMLTSGQNPNLATPGVFLTWDDYVHTVESHWPGVSRVRLPRGRPDGLPWR